MENVTNLELEMLAEAAAKVAEEHEHHHHHDGECGCGHDHHDEEHEHHHHHDDECGCGHDHHDEEHEHHHHDGECGCGHHHEHGHHHADEVFTSWGVETPNKYDKEELSEILRKLSETDDYGNILRAKGMLPFQSGLNAGRAQMHTLAIQAFGKWMDEQGMSEEDKKKFELRFRELLPL